VVGKHRTKARVYGRECGKENLNESGWMQVWRWLPVQKQGLTKHSVSNAPGGALQRPLPTHLPRSLGSNLPAIFQ